MSELLIVTERVGSVFVIRLDSPASRNSLAPELREQLAASVTIADSDHSIRSVLVTGTGPTFCSGGDLNAIRSSHEPWAVHRRFRATSRWLTPMVGLEKPVVVAVNGHAVGAGLGLALGGDLLIASERAEFIAGFFRLGAVPDFGLMYHLPRLVGMAQAKNFLFGKGRWTAAEAERIGLVSQVVADEQLYDTALAKATQLAEGPAEAMGLAKTLMARSFETGWHDMFAFEGLGQALAMSHPEFEEGLEAAIERRPPDFLAAGRR